VKRTVFLVNKRLRWILETIDLFPIAEVNVVNAETKTEQRCISELLTTVDGFNYFQSLHFLSRLFRIELLFEILHAPIIHQFGKFPAPWTKVANVFGPIHAV